MAVIVDHILLVQHMLFSGLKIRNSIFGQAMLVKVGIRLEIQVVQLQIMEKQIFKT